MTHCQAHCLLRRPRAVAACRRAFTLVEVVAWTGLLGIVTALALPLFRTTLRLLYESDARQAKEVREDLALQQLRRDLWGARSIELA